MGNFHIFKDFMTESNFHFQNDSPLSLFILMGFIMKLLSLPTQNIWYYNAHKNFITFFTWVTVSTTHWSVKIKLPTKFIKMYLKCETKSNYMFNSGARMKCEIMNNEKVTYPSSKKDETRNWQLSNKGLIITGGGRRGTGAHIPPKTFGEGDVPLKFWGARKVGEKK